MTQPSKPSSYLKAAARVLRLQRALSRTKGATHGDSAPGSLSTPCSPTTPSFQHSNGRRLSYSQLLHHHHQLHLHHHTHGGRNPRHQHQLHGHLHLRPDHLESPLHSIQRRRNSSYLSPAPSSPSLASPAVAISSSSSSHSSLVSYKQPPRDSALYYPSSRTASPSRLNNRRSGPSFYGPLTACHHHHHHHHHLDNLDHYCQSNASTPSLILPAPLPKTGSGLSRSKSAPTRRRKRLTTSTSVLLPVPYLDIILVAKKPTAEDTLPTDSTASSTHEICESPLAIEGPAPMFPETQSGELPQQQRSTDHASSSIMPTHVSSARKVAKPDPIRQDSGAFMSEDEKDMGSASPNLRPTSPSVHDSDRTNVHKNNSPILTVSTTPLPMTDQSKHSRSMSGSSSFSRLSRSLLSPRRSNSILSFSDNKEGISMMMAEASPSSLSEAAMLSATLSVNGLLPSMEIMLDEVDRQIAADGVAQLVENAHVGLAHVSVVDSDLLPEPCSAKIEMWVN